MSTKNSYLWLVYKGNYFILHDRTVHIKSAFQQICQNCLQKYIPWLLQNQISIIWINCLITVVILSDIDFSLQPMHMFSNSHWKLSRESDLRLQYHHDLGWYTTLRRQILIRVWFVPVFIVWCYNMLDALMHWNNTYLGIVWRKTFFFRNLIIQLFVLIIVLCIPSIFWTLSDRSHN